MSYVPPPNRKTLPSPPAALNKQAEAMRKQQSKMQTVSEEDNHAFYEGRDTSYTVSPPSPHSPPPARVTPAAKTGAASAASSSQDALPVSPSFGAEYELCSWLLRLTPEQIPVAMHINTRLKPSDLSDPTLSNIFRCAMHLVAQNNLSSVSGVADYAAQNHISIGTAQDLSAIVSDTISLVADVDRIQQDVDIILEHSQRRAMRLMLLDYATQLDSHSVAEVKARLEANLQEFATLSSSDNEPTHISELMEEVLDGLDEDESTLTVIPTGFTEADERMNGGLRGGDYIIVGARPSMGKTAWSLTVGRNISMDTRHSYKVLVFSGEMKGASLASRMLAGEAAVPASALRKGGEEVLNNNQYMNSILEVMPRFASFNPDMPHTSRLWIDDQSGLNSSQIVTRARNFVRLHGRAVIIVDYLQLISAGNYARLPRHEQVSAISRDLKNVARELDCPLIVLSQLSRDLEKRTDKRPIMSDLRESGAIEQDADMVLFLYRDFVYNPDTPEPDKAELIYAKQRDGAIGTVPMTFSSQYVRFSNRSNDYYDG